MFYERAPLWQVEIFTSILEWPLTKLFSSLTLREKLTGLVGCVSNSKWLSTTLFFSQASFFSLAFYSWQETRSNPCHSFLCLSTLGIVQIQYEWYPKVVLSDTFLTHDSKISEICRVSYFQLYLLPWGCGLHYQVMYHTWFLFNLNRLIKL